MNKKQKHTDSLESLFHQLPEEEVPVAFHFNVMQQVMAEAIKAKKRNERLEMLTTILASLVMIVLGVLAFLFIGLPKISIPWLDSSICSFYLYIGMLTLFLLFVDYKLRRVFHKDDKS